MSTYRQLEAGHHALEWSQTLLNQDQIQEICMHYWPDEQTSKMSKLDLVAEVILFFFKCLVKISGAYIIDLARHKHFALILNRRKWAPTCKNGTSLMVIHKNKGRNTNTYE